MNILMSEIEKQFIALLDSFRASLPDIPAVNSQVDKLFILHIIINRLKKTGLDITQVEFDALADDIEAYINRSISNLSQYMEENHKANPDYPI